MFKKSIDVSGFWSYTSTFFNYLDEQSRDLWEFFWEGITYTSSELIRFASRFLYSSSPERSFTTPSIQYYDLKIDILTAKPISLDQTDPYSRTNIIVNKIIPSLPLTSGERRDILQISDVDYLSIRDIAVGGYAIIESDNIDSRYFVVNKMLSPKEEDNRKSDIYGIELYNANLSYIPKNAKISIHLTNGKAFNVDSAVTDLPYLYFNISEDDTLNLRLVKDIDYSFTSGTVEFFTDLIASGRLKNGSYLYGKEIPVMEWNLYNSYGSLVNIPSWTLYGHDNISGKAAINTAVKSAQNSSNKTDYEKALNVYYGLSISPEQSEIVGLFESYDYEVTDVNVGSKLITLKSRQNFLLHQFIQPGTKFVVTGTDNIVQADYDFTIDRELWKLTMTSVDDIFVGSKLNIKLPNRLAMNMVSKPYADNSTIRVSHYTDGGEIQHIYDKLQKYPEILVHENDTFNGYYHFKSVTSSQEGYVSFKVDDCVGEYDEPINNDFINLSEGSQKNVSIGYVHIPWPTHKYLLLKFDDGFLYKCYLDSPIDTIYDTGDKVEKYQPLSRCISVINQGTFPNWNEFSGYSRNNGIDVNSNILEMIYTIPNTKFGVYMS